MARRSSGIVESGDRGLAEGDDATRNDRTANAIIGSSRMAGSAIELTPGSLPSLGAAVGNPNRAHGKRVAPEPTSERPTQGLPEGLRLLRRPWVLVRILVGGGKNRLDSDKDPSRN